MLVWYNNGARLTPLRQVFRYYTLSDWLLKSELMPCISDIDKTIDNLILRK